MSHLTPDQSAVLKAHILADPTLGPLTSGPGTDYGAIAVAMSAIASPAFMLWHKAVTPDMWRAALTKGASQLDALTVGKRDSLLFVCGGTLDCADPLIRSNLDDLMGAQNTLKAVMQAAQKRPATRAEKVLATGVGSDASPGTPTYEGGLDLSQVAAMFNV